MVRKSRSTFKKDLTFGQTYEHKAADYLKYKTIKYAKGYCKGYDLILNGKTKIEVKSDRMAHKTGNLAIEYYCNNRKSGILSTESVKWVYFIVYPTHDDCYIITTKALLKLCEKYGKGIAGGDGGRSALKLLNKKYMKKYLKQPLDKTPKTIETPKVIETTDITE